MLTNITATLRNVALTDRQRMIALPGGIAEDIIYQPFNGPAVDGRGIWSEMPTDALKPVGIGAENRTSDATLVIALSLAPSLSRRDTFKRKATGETWKIEQVPLTSGVGYRITLTKSTEATVRGLR